jgi:polyhydroxyalkanoate synthesis regulator phasin
VQGGEEGQAGISGQDPWWLLQDLWQSYHAVLMKGSGEGRDQRLGAWPDMMMKAFQPLLEGISLTQRQWAGFGENAATRDAGDELGNLAERMSRTWLGSYEEEFRKFLNIPQLGLTRFYQERANLALEKYTYFQTAIGEFLGVLLKPMSIVFQEMQDEIKKVHEGEEEILKDSKAYYNLWMKKMEARYLDLLRSPEYTDSLKSTLLALKDFRVARQQFLTDLLQDIPVPTHKDMDEVYKDLYELKKRVRRIEKKEGRHEKG